MPCFSVFKMLIHLLCASLFNCHSLLWGFWGFFFLSLYCFFEVFQERSEITLHLFNLLCLTRSVNSLSYYTHSHFELTLFPNFYDYIHDGVLILVLQPWSLQSFWVDASTSFIKVPCWVKFRCLKFIFTKIKQILLSHWERSFTLSVSSLLPISIHYKSYEFSLYDQQIWLLSFHSYCSALGLGNQNALLTFQLF